MRLAHINSKYVCGVDLHGQSKYICVMNKEGETLLHKNMKNDFNSFINSVARFMPDISVGVESMHSYYWLADACIDNNIPFFLGHPYYMKSIHGGKTKNDKIDSKKIADLMRSNHFPVGFIYPKHMRATRDLLRRRIRFMKIRAEAYAHIQTIFRQLCMNISPKDVKNKKERRLLIDKVDDLQIKSSIEMNLNLIDFFDVQLGNVEKQIREMAKYHDRTSLNILLTVPGIGDMMSLVILYEIGDINRFPSQQDFSSYARLVKCERSSANKKFKGGFQKIGNPYLKWAFGEIIIHAPTFSSYIKDFYDRLIARTGKPKARAIITHKFGVAVFNMLKHKEVFNEKRFVQFNMNQ